VNASRTLFKHVLKENSLSEVSHDKYKRSNNIARIGKAALCIAILVFLFYAVNQMQSSINEEHRLICVLSQELDADVKVAMITGPGPLKHINYVQLPKVEYSSDRLVKIAAILSHLTELHGVDVTLAGLDAEQSKLLRRELPPVVGFGEVGVFKKHDEHAIYKTVNCTTDKE